MSKQASQKRGVLFIMSAPAGTGKTTLASMLVKGYPSIVRSISYTTRDPRGLEKNAKDYFFVSEEEFSSMKQKGEFLETAQIYGHHYGTSKAQVEELLGQGKHVLLVIDTQGSKRLKNQVEAVRVFVSPPSMEELENRLEKRKTESKEDLQKRLDFAQRELQTKDEYDYHIINDDLQRAYEVLKAIIVAEEHRI